MGFLAIEAVPISAFKKRPHLTFLSSSALTVKEISVYLVNHANMDMKEIQMTQPALSAHSHQMPAVLQ